MKRWLVVLSLLGGTVISGYLKSPAFRAFVLRQVHELSGWNENARKSDPAGFVDHVRTELTADLRQMQESGNRLAAETATLVTRRQELRELQSQAATLAELFRSEWKSQSFPIVVCNAAYSQEQAESQVQLLLDQISQFDDSLKRISEAETLSDEKLRSLTLQIDRTKTSLSLLDMQKELLQAEQLSENGEQLISQLNELLSENHSVIAGTPVRSVEELLHSKPTKESAARSSARRYLSGEDADQERTVNQASAIQTSGISQDKDNPQESAEVKVRKPAFSQF